MKLYYSPGVCSQAPHIVLREAGLDFTLEKVDAKTKKTEFGADYLAINPNGYVPALEVEPGLMLTEGPAIMQFIADKKPAAKLAPANGSLERYQLQSWLNFITSELHKSYSPLFKPNMPTEAKTIYRDLIAQRLQTFEQRFAKQDFVLESGFSIADAYLFVVTGWSGFVGVDLNNFPNVTAFRERVKQRPAVQAALEAEGLLK